MMIMMMNDNIRNMANMMAEDTGAYELRNPLAGGMRNRGLLRRLFGRKK